MSGQSPANVLYSSDGYELAVQDSTVVPTGTRALLISGKDGYTGRSHYVPSTALGVLGTTEMANTFAVLSNVTVTASGSQLIVNNNFGVQEIALVVNVGTVTGAGNITFTIQEVDPGDGVTVYGNSASTTAISTGNAPGVFTAALAISTSSMAKVTWTVSGTFSAAIYATVVSKATPFTQTINGSISATNPSVGSDNAAALTFDTQVGGVVSASAPTYTAGNLNALSLTTAGDLRVVANQGTSPWVISGTVTANAGTGNFNNASVGTDGAAALGFDTQVGGRVSTADPTYTNGNLDALSLTTSGRLRTDVTGTVAVSSVSGTVAVTQSTSPWIIAGGGTAGSPASGVVTIQGISGMTHLAGDGYTFTTTAAPTYTTGTWNPFSTDTSGNLRVVATQGTSPWVTSVTGTVAVTQSTTPWVVVTNKAATSSVTSVAQSTSNTVILASAATRQFASIYNNSGQKMYIKLGTTASTSSYSIQLMPNSYWEVPVDYTGEIDAVWSGNGSGNALVTELTP